MIRRMLVVALVVGALLAVMLTGVLVSSGGTRFLVGWSVDRFAPALELEGVEGSALGRLCASRLSYQASGVAVKAANVCVRLNLWTSFDYLMFNAQSLDAAEVEISTEPTAIEADAGNDIALPFAVAVNQVRIPRLVVNDVEIRDLRTSLDLSNDDLRSSGSFVVFERPAQLTTTGSWTALRGEASYYGVHADVTADLRDDRMPYSGVFRADRLLLDEVSGREIVVENVEVTGGGDLDRYRFNAEGHVADPSARGTVRLAGEGDRSGIDLSRVEIRQATVVGAPVAVTMLEATASVRWQGEEFVRLRNVAATGTLDGHAVEAMLREALITWRDEALVELRDVVARGTVRERSLTATASRVSVDAQGVDLTQAKIGLREPQDSAHRLEVNGHIGADATLSLRAAGTGLPLGLLDERLDGALDVRVALTGAATRPVVDGRYRMHGVRYRDQVIDSVTGTVAGPYDDGEVEVSMQSAMATLAGRFAYRVQAEGVNLAVRAADLQLAHSPLGPVRASLLEPLTIAIGDGSVRSSHGCLQLSVSDHDVESASICGAVSYPGGPLTVELERWRLPAPTVPGEWMSFSGVAQGEVRLQTLDPPTGHASVSLHDLLAHREEVEALPLGSFELTLDMDDERAVATLLSVDSHTLAVRGEVASHLSTPVGESAVDGNVTLQLDNIWAPGVLLPMDLAYELGDVRGVLALRADVSGTVSAPQLAGELTLSDAAWRVPALNAVFSDFGLRAGMTESQRLRFEGEGEVGGGGLVFSGELNEIATAQASLVTEIRLQDAVVVDLPDYTAVIDGRLALVMTPSSLQLDADLTVPRAFIRIAELPTTAVSVSADQVLVGEEATAPVQQIRTTDVRLGLGDQVALRAFGLSGNLVGNLRVRESPGKLREVTGTISIRDGSFEIYGRTLRIERGGLTFTGPEDDPGVNVIASRVVPFEDQDYRITLAITGTARNLETVVRSTPALSEEDALALLITGSTLAQSTAGQQSNVYGAAIGLGLSTTGITRSVASAIGVEEIILEQDTEGNMEYGAAVRFNQDLYLRYTYGAFSRIGGVLLRYRLSRRVSVQAKTGDAHSIEIRYGVDD